MGSMDAVGLGIMLCCELVMELWGNDNQVEREPSDERLSGNPSLLAQATTRSSKELSRS